MVAYNYMVADMEMDMVAYMELDIVVDMEVDIVADMAADMLADMVRELVLGVGLLGPKLTRLAILLCFYLLL